MNLKKFIKQNPLRFYVSIVLLVFMTAISILVSNYISQTLTNVVLQHDLRTFTFLLVLEIIFGILEYVFYTCAQYLNQIQEQDLNNRVRSLIVNHYYDDGQEHKVAEVQNRLTNDLNIINQSYFTNIFYYIYGLSAVIFVLIYLIKLNWLLLLTICLMTTLSLLLPRLIEKPLQKATEAISESNQKYLDVLNDWLQGLGQIRQFMAGDKLFSVTARASKKIEDATVKQTAYTKSLNAITGIVSAIFGLILFILTGYLVKNKIVTVGVLVIIGNFRFNLNNGIQMMIGARTQMKGTKTLIEKVNKSMARIKNKEEHDGEVPAAIITKDLSLKFPNGERLTYPNLTINKGEKILLTGDSGAGKSTLFKLILGDIKPSSGKVLFKNSAGQEIEADTAKIGYIPQDPIVFPASIKDNITMFNDHLDDKVEKVTEEVNLKADLSKFKDGIKQKINLDKLNISGGQRQKIVLARAKIHDSDIILIDEGTSAIDQKATMDILSGLVKTKSTIVFIAHNFNEDMRQLFDREIHLVK
ncbi:MAG: ABC transporter ATP-binding protein/permease [Candidatus Lactobacillus pullistercoris]|uniref:ABC transporter ATP-binding protein/permease n=1 Tax=Candidatus Lactobacillus pullistercoris TaxID=2838636 RepID=A0A9E2KQJ5_9LACO|nr:ABC transporter ATP-binding protein/permease [Candidatus Lactobacillus pullistercoris]